MRRNLRPLTPIYKSEKIIGALDPGNTPPWTPAFEAYPVAVYDVDFRGSSLPSGWSPTSPGSATDFDTTYGFWRSNGASAANIQDDSSVPVAALPAGTLAMLCATTSGAVYAAIYDATLDQSAILNWLGYSSYAVGERWSMSDSNGAYWDMNGGGDGTARVVLMTVAWDDVAAEVTVTILDAPSSVYGSGVGAYPIAIPDITPDRAVLGVGVVSASPDVASVARIALWNAPLTPSQVLSLSVDWM